nr:hypothetical protein [Cellulomonas sp. Leaf395]
MLLERPQCPGQLLLATEEPFGVTRARGRQAEVRTLRVRGPEHPVGQQRGILAEDRLLQLGELRARIQTELGSEQPPRPADGGERVRLPALPVLRHAQHDPAPLAQRCFGGAGACERGDLRNLARLEPCIQEQLLDTEPNLLQTSGRDLSRFPVGKFDVGLPPPQRERRRERVRGAFGLTELQLLRTPRDEPFEPLRVDLDVLRDESVPVSGGVDPRRRDEAAQPHDASGDDLRPRGGRIVAPQRRREGCGRHLRTQADRERGHHRTIPRRQGNPAVVECQRSQNAHHHGATVTPTPTSDKTADIAPIPNPRAPISC